MIRVFTAALLLTASAAGKDFYAEMVKVIPPELQYKFKKVKGENAYQLIQNTFKKVDTNKVPNLLDKVWEDKVTAGALLKKYAKSLAFLDKISKMDYALPADYRFSFLHIENFSYLRFLVRLRALSLSVDKSNVNKALLTLRFLKIYGRQPNSYIQQLVIAACQKVLVRELKKLNPDNKTVQYIKACLIDKKDLKNAVRAEIYVAVSVMESMGKSDPDTIAKYDSALVVNKLSVYAGSALDLLEAKITREEFLKKVEPIKNTDPDVFRRIKISEKAYRSAILETYSGTLTPKVIDKLPVWP